MVIGSNLIVREELPSTNSEASYLLKREDMPEGTVIWAGFQTAGRGQPGNRWESEKGKNLLISIILYPQSIQPGEQFLISMSISLGICDFLGGYSGECTVKWPNDIYVIDDKIAGILIENSIMGDVIESTVAGIGLNINQEKFPASVRNPVSLRNLTGREYDTETCLQELLRFLDKRYKQLLYGDRQKLHDEYRRHLYRFGELHEYRAGGKVISGRITDVSTSGILTIKNESGKALRFSFKELDFMI